MITLSILNLKTKKVATEVFSSKDKAEKRLNELNCSKAESLQGISCDTEVESALARPYLDRANERKLKS